MISKEDYEYLSRFLEQNSGLFLGPQKEYLLESRLQGLFGEFGLQSFSELTSVLRGGSRPELAKRVIWLMTTNESLFFRDALPFDYLENVMLPTLLKAKSAFKRLRIWSCGCSTGQEPYSIAMSLTRAGALLQGWDIEILATDLSVPILQRAREGVYSDFEVRRGLNERDLNRFFTRDPARGWIVNDEVRRRVNFREFNLMDPFGTIGPFDVIFCRYVLIYFHGDRKKEIINQFADITSPGGFLALGGTETVLGLSNRYEILNEVRASIYRKVG